MKNTVSKFTPTAHINMQADDLILFSQVIEQGSFSKAAEANNLSKSLISKRIARLEKELGVQLLYRTTRKLTVTEAGKVLAQQAKNVQLATNEACAAISGFGDQISGHVKMSVPTISGDLILAEAVASFCDQHPSLSVDMSLDNRFVDLIQDGYDLAIRTGFLDDSSLIARHLIDSQWVVVASPSYLLKHGTPTTPKELRNHNCLRYIHPARGASAWEFRATGSAGKAGSNTSYVVDISGSFSSNNATALRKAILAGFGIAYVPRCLVFSDIQSADLIELFSGEASKKIGVYAVYPYTKHPPMKIKKLIAFIKTRYQEMGHYFSA